MRVGLTLICQFIRSSSSHHRPGQIALGITIGLLIGLLPKTTALFACVGLISFFMPVHLPLLTLTAFVASFAAPLLEAPLGQLGLWSLTHPRSAAFWFKLDRLPLVPWLGIHNSVVHGSFMLWMCSAIPVYVCSRSLSRVFVMDELEQQVATIVDSFKLVNEPAATIIAPTNQEPRAYKASLEAGTTSSIAKPVTPPIVVWDDASQEKAADATKPLRFELDKLLAAQKKPATYAGMHSNTDDMQTQDDEALTADQVRQRAADLAAWAEELISEELLLDNRPHAKHEPAEVEASITDSNFAEESAADSTQSPVDDEERWLIETTMEVVRIAERAVTNQAALKAKNSEAASANHLDENTANIAEDVSDTDKQFDNVTSTSNPTEESTVNFAQNPRQFGTTNSPSIDMSSLPAESTIRREQSPHSDHRSHLDTTRTTVSVGGNRPREEALHYLLRHLKGIQEKAQKQ